MRILVFLLLLTHGLIHGLGGAKAFGWLDLPALSAHVSRLWGGVWLVAGLLTILTAILYLQRQPLWWFWGLAALLFSQAAVFAFWGDARWATLV
ncbi:MAG: hypothetical protein D6722_25625, partial [Bacteroidetes bacterium]